MLFLNPLFLNTRTNTNIDFILSRYIGHQGGTKSLLIKLQGKNCTFDTIYNFGNLKVQKGKWEKFQRVALQGFKIHTGNVTKANILFQYCLIWTSKNSPL